ncbi:hypothetical protein PF008_g24770 [Phytophthora fragariae]|uniref:Uncharacterized protein n=1 Tax=Phytophthora fragariae TaxID=53985 RepID=A0A6G0QLY0_9STRA|nr:hypothetical protein PF008_g24770 [Phytophthora fragariae]
MSSPDHGSRDLAMEALISPRVRVEDVVVAQRQTRTFESSLARSLQTESEQKVEQVAKKAEVVQQLTLEQLNRFQQQQETLAAKTTEYLQQQYENQVELNTKQAALSAQLEEQQKALVQQYQLLREAAETVGHQGRQIEDSKEEVLSPRGQSRWGWFARSTGQGGRERDGDEPMVGGDASENRNEPTITVATGSNMPVPPVYRGSTKREKMAFMDS